MRRIVTLWCAALLLATPCYAEVLFSDDFEAQPDLTTGSSPSSVGGICTGHASGSPSYIYHQANPGVNDKGVKLCTGSGCCNNMPRGWSYYLSKTISGAETLQIKSGAANDNHDGIGGSKSVYYHMISTDTSGSPNDAQLNWHYLDTLEHRKGLPDMWVQYRVRVSPQWNMDTDNGGGGSNMLKLGRFGNYLGDGEYSGSDGRNVYNWESNINSDTHVPFTYHNFGKSSNYFFQASPRCGNYCYECCLNSSCNTAGGSCSSGGGSDTQRFMWNYAKTRSCEGLDGDVTEQYIDSGDPLYKARWDESVMCDDTTGSGTILEGYPGPDPICYGFSGATASGNGERCNQSYSSGSTCFNPGGNIPCDYFVDDKSPGNVNDGDWHIWTFHLKMNSCHGCADGWFEQWIDGYKIHELRNLRWIPSGWSSRWAGHDYDDDIRGFNYFGLFGNKAARVGMGSTTNHWMAVDDVVIATTQEDIEAHPFYGATTCDNDGDCSDGLACTGTETCVGAPGGTCQAGTLNTCDDSNACTTDSCNEPGGGCTNDAISCDDGIACTIDTGICNTSTGCPASASRATTCSAGQECNLASGLCQDPDVAPGLPLDGTQLVELRTSATPPAANWYTVAFHASNGDAWADTPLGIGRWTPTAGGAGANCSNDIASDLTDNYVIRNLYIHDTFDIADKDAISQLILQVSYDDGLKCWLNDNLIINENSTPDAYGDVASANHDCGSGGDASFETYNPSPSFLVNGDNLMACRFANRCEGSSSTCADDKSFFFSYKLDYSTTGASTECNDSIDNDGDGLTDYAGGAGDPGCTADSDMSEYGTAECDDGEDNEAAKDGLIDYRVTGGDPGCTSLTDASEYGTDVCDDSNDNDGDGNADMADQACIEAGPTGTSEIDCGDGIVSAGEECEQGVPISQSCAEFAPSEWASGTLTCDAGLGCVFNTDACIPLPTALYPVSSGGNGPQ